MNATKLEKWLRKASEAHHLYEAEFGKDEDWPRFYALYVECELKHDGHDHSNLMDSPQYARRLMAHDLQDIKTQIAEQNAQLAYKFNGVKQGGQEL